MSTSPTRLRAVPLKACRVEGRFYIEHYLNAWRRSGCKKGFNLFLILICIFVQAVVEVKNNVYESSGHQIFVERQSCVAAA